MSRFLLIILLLSFSFRHVSAQDASIITHHFTNNFDSSDTLPGWININTKTQGQAHSGNYYSKTDAANPYGAGIEIEFPADLKKKNKIVTFHASLHVADTNQKIILVTTCTSKDSSIFWSGVNVAKKFGKANEWVSITDSNLLPSNFPGDAKLKIFLWNQDVRTEAGIDDVDIQLTEVKTPSYIMPFVPDVQGGKSFEVSFKNNFYTFSTDKSSGAVKIESASGQSILSSAKYFGQLINNTGDTSTIREAKFISSASQNINAPVQFILKEQTDASEITISCEFQQDSPEIKFTVEEKYKKKVKVFREAMLLNFDVPVTEVYRKNRQLQDADFQSEYWLDKEGAKFGKGERSAFVYHAPQVSSLQLNTEKQQLIVNLDYKEDHPFEHFPLLDSAQNKKVDLSCTEHNAGDVRKNSFSLYVGQDVAMPRLMLNPDGYLSTYVFTEHADWGDMRTHRATYFGSEDIKRPGRAKGGFVKNKIPVTKSVFYANPDSVLNNQSRHESISQTPIANIKTTDGFEKFLKQLNKRGYDICLHTPDQFTATQPLLTEAIAYMKENFNSVSWIDHGYDNGAKNNREDFICDGLDSISPSYAAGLWAQYGTKYFWDAYHEDYTPADSNYLFNSSLIKPYIGFGDCFPTPVYAQHPNISNKFYQWFTRDLLEMPDAGTWSYQFSAERLNDFANNSAVAFNHCYPAGSIVNKGFWTINEKNKIIINPEFEKALQRLAAYRNSGLINLTTVRDIMNYWTALEKIKFDYLPGGKIKVTNTSSLSVKGLSLAVRASKVLVSGKTPSSKMRGNDFIFWFNIKAGESKEIEVK